MSDADQLRELRERLTQLAGVETRLEETLQPLKTTLEALEKRLEKVEALEKRLEKVEALEKRLEKVDVVRLEHVEVRAQTIDERLTKVTNELTEYKRHLLHVKPAVAKMHHISGDIDRSAKATVSPSMTLNDAAAFLGVLGDRFAEFYRETNDVTHGSQA